GELCAMRWNLLDLHAALLTIRTSIAQQGSKKWEKDTKTYQQRRIALDADTVGLLRSYRQHCETEASAVGRVIAPGGRLFSPDSDHGGWLKPATVGQRYQRMCAKLGWDMNIHQLRHYSATELISAGVDARTVAGRLGHGGGGATTLRVYTAWVSEADQRAAHSLSARMPAPPVSTDSTGSPVLMPVPAEPDSPYRQIAADLRGAIACSALPPGSTLPTVAAIAARYSVSFGTAQRAVAELRSAGLVTVSRGRRAIVAEPGTKDSELAEVVNLTDRQ
ncbi:MAG: tyrosine-type recombinase/integrase, partial [Sciscionella sp.]